MSSNISELTKIKRNIYISLARLALKDKLVERLDNLPEQLVTADTPRYRCCEYKEQAIIRERIKLAMGFDPEKVNDLKLSELATQIQDVQPETPVINVLSIACDRCPIDKYMVTDACRNCVAHNCVHSCPKNAIVIIQNRAFIDQGKCIECGRCKDVCPFGAIHQNSRPCERSCAVNAIQSAMNRQASIDHDKCVGCGSCILGCPFGAIGDKTWIVQVVKMLKDPNVKVKGILAPSFVGQFGAKISPEKIKAALLEIGFSEVYEAALGADMVAIHEAHELMERIHEGEPFMTSSCCPSFLGLIHKHYPQLRDKVSSTVSPMIALGRSLKEQDRQSKVVFIGPCIAKKIEAEQDNSIDAVLTFEELGCILVSRGINLAEYQAEVEVADASKHGRNFAYAGGLAGVMLEVFEAEGHGELINSCRVDGLLNCVDILKKLSTGEHWCNFIEGMGCSGGCVGGPGVMMNGKVITKLVQNFADQAKCSQAVENQTVEKKLHCLSIGAMER